MKMKVGEDGFFQLCRKMQRVSKDHEIAYVVLVYEGEGDRNLVYVLIIMELVSLKYHEKSVLGGTRACWLNIQWRG